MKVNGSKDGGGDFNMSATGPEAVEENAGLGMEIPNHERLLIVLGMARSGTTIFTYVLCRHPQIAIFRGGPEAWVLENQCLPQRNARRIARVAQLFPGVKHVALKRPWQEEHGKWLSDHMPRAHFMVLVRDRETIKKSWETTGSWAVGNRPQAKTNPDEYYDYYLEHALALPHLLGENQCRIVRYEELIANPKGIFEDIAEWLKLERLFDCSPIAAGRRWTREYADEFPRGDRLLDR
jgi:hypothetical protein